MIGENGSGKSTLLRLMAGISTPDAGTIRVAQPVAPILELGLGFHPEFTGRENALLYGSLLGIPEEAMAERLDDVLAFAELGEFVDRPLRTYSSGMTARLAFAVATNVDPAVLVVDEALAVGDGAFQKKCVDRMVRFKEEGRTVLFCSHSMYLVTSFCERAVWLHHGRIQSQGPCAGGRGGVRELPDAAREAPAGAAEPRPRGYRRRREAGAGASPPCACWTLDGAPAEAVAPGSGFQVAIELESADPATAFHVGVAVDTQDGRCVFAATTHLDGVAPLAGAIEVRGRACASQRCRWRRARSRVSGFLFDEHGLHTYDQVVVPAALRRRGGALDPGAARTRPRMDRAGVMRRPLAIVYLLEDTTLFGGVKIVLHQAELMARRGHQVTVVSKGERPAWFPLRTGFQRVPTFAPGAPPRSRRHGRHVLDHDRGRGGGALGRGGALLPGVRGQLHPQRGRAPGDPRRIPDADSALCPFASPRGAGGGTVRPAGPRRAACAGAVLAAGVASRPAARATRSDRQPVRD